MFFEDSPPAIERERERGFEGTRLVVFRGTRGGRRRVSGREEVRHRSPPWLPVDPGLVRDGSETPSLHQERRRGRKHSSAETVFAEERATETFLGYFAMLSKILDVPKGINVTSAEPAPQHKMAASPAPQHKMAASPAPQHKMAASPAPQHRMVDSTPESSVKEPPARHHRGRRRRRQASAVPQSPEGGPEQAAAVQEDVPERGSAVQGGSVHQWFNRNVMKQREYFLYTKKKK